MPGNAQSNPERVEYQLSSGYVKDWGMKEALRELFANALDEGAKYRVEFIPHDPDSTSSRRKGVVEVCDEGGGLSREYLMMGGGESKTAEQIGQFKEGLKIAMLVAARQGREFSLRTAGFNVDRVALESGQLGRSLVVYLSDSTRYVGTSVRVEATQLEFNNAVRMFVNLNAVGSGAGARQQKPSEQGQEYLLG